jgi:hypothetical protein
MTNEDKRSAQPMPRADGTVKRKPAPPQRRRSRLPRWLRIVFRILRLLLVPALCAGALIGGLIVGYVYVGGQEMSEVWDLKTWKHVFDLVFAKG